MPQARRHIGQPCFDLATRPSDAAQRRSSSPTTWNESLPISMLITATALLRFWDVACSLSLEPLARFVAGGAGARPDTIIEVGCKFCCDAIATSRLLRNS